jgi:hypothetical protein
MQKISHDTYWAELFASGGCGWRIQSYYGLEAQEKEFVYPERNTDQKNVNLS